MVKVLCPNCSKELNAPDALIGRVAACPKCATKFPISQSSDSPRTDLPEATSYYPPGHAQPTSGAPPVASGSGAISTPGNGASPADAPNAPPAPPDTEGKNHRQPRFKEAPASVQSPADRKVKRARFVSGGNTTTRVSLGEDGQLPELKVQEGKKSETKPEDKQNSQPMLLAVALCVSVAMSVAMLFISPEALKTQSKSKVQARKQLEQFYIGKAKETSFEPYEELLREALRASSHGDEKTARRKYRQVLDMLHSEDKAGSIGLVGPKYATAPPNDKDLEEQLSVLLSR